MDSKCRRESPDNYDSLLEGIKGIVDQMEKLADMAVVQYTLLVNNICSRKATRNEVELLFDYMFCFLGNERMLQLFKQVCRHYFYIYPSSVHSYILDYRKEYDPESLKGTEYEYLLNEDEELENNE